MEGLNSSDSRSSWAKWAGVLSYAVFLVDALALVLEKLHAFGIEFSEGLKFWLFIIALVSLFSTLWFAYQHVLSTIRELYWQQHVRVIDVMSSIKGIDSTRKESDVARKLLEVQLGTTITSILIPDGVHFPLTLVPGGDIALTLSQRDYGEMLQRLLSQVKEWQVSWTTFVPFELLNKGLAYGVETWCDRINENSIKSGQGINALWNEVFFDIVSQWDELLNQRQIIIMARPYGIDMQHPLNLLSYAQGGNWNLDILKYLAVRYKVACREQVIEWDESKFLECCEAIKVRDSSCGDHLKWIFLDMIRKVCRNHGIDINSLYSFDLLYLQSRSCRFCLARVDPSNYLDTPEKGVVGVTFIVTNAEKLSTYSQLFDAMWNEEAKPTF